MKKFFIGFFLGATIFSSIGVFAKDISEYVVSKVSFPVLVNGKVLTSDKPFITLDGSTYLPLKDIGVALGIKVAWNDKDGRVEIGVTPAAVQTPTTTPAPTTTPPATPSATNEITQAKNNEVYDIGKAVQIGSSLAVGSDGFRTDINKFLYSENKYYVVVDFSIANLSEDDYNSTLANFTLVDPDGFTYEPYYIYQGRGSVEGTIKSKDVKRGEIAFIVPGPQSLFELNFNTGVDSAKNIKFKIDIKALKK